VRLSIVLPCADDDGIERCLASIDEDVEVVAVLNGAHPSVRAAVASRQLTVVEIPERNLGAACQAGCVAAANDHVLLMNTDATFAPGALAKMMADWRPGTVVRASLVFDGDNARARWIENLQNHQMSNPDRAYQPGLLFSRAIVDDIGGYFFDEHIHWTEDADFDRRARAVGVTVTVSAGVVRHGAVTVTRKLRSAFRYGLGRAIAERKRLYGTTPHYRPKLSAFVADAKATAARYGTPTAAYGVIWNLSFMCGVYAQRWFDVYGVHERVDTSLAGGAPGRSAAQ